MTKYKLKKDRFEVPAGTTVYALAKYDYGLASEDTRITGIEHISVTQDPSGDYPSITVAIDDLEEINEEPSSFPVFKPFDSYEISPCIRTEEPDKPGHFYFEVCEPAEADVWTLYGHIPGEGAMAIGDFDTREHAEEAFQRITGIPFAETGVVQNRVRVMHAGPKMLSALKLASNRLGTLIDADEDTENDCKAYDAVCAAIVEAEERAA